MLGQKNMADKPINLEIMNKSNILRRQLKDLQEIMFGLYDNEMKSNNNTLIFIKRNMDKLKLASRYILDIDMNKIVTSEKLNENKELSDIYKETLININKFSNILSRKLSEEQRRTGSTEINSLKRNMDNLRLAQNVIKTIDSDMDLTQKEWEEKGR